MSRTIFNELGDSRVINPRSGYSQFVDLSNNQTIFGEKRFLSNLTTNSNINFNKTNNIGRVVIHPNTALEGIINIYTVDETDGKRWEFSNNGDLCYIGLSPNPYKIIFSPTGDITGEILTGKTSLKTNLISPYTGTDTTCTSDTYFKNSSLLNRVSIVSSVTTGEIVTIRITAGGGGRFHFSTNSNFGYFNGSSHIFFVNGPTGDMTCGIITSGAINASSNISTTGTLKANTLSPNTGTTITCTSTLLTLGSGNLSTTGTLIGGILQSNNILSSSSITKINMNNLFIDTVNPSVDIIANYIGFPNPSQTLTTASKYMYIKPLTTGDFELRINNIPNTVLTTDWSQLGTGTQFSSNWYSTAGVLMGFINPNPPSVGPTMRIMGTANQYIYYNTSNNFGNFNSTTSVTNWEIFNNGNFSTLGSILSNTINQKSGTTISSNAIWNYKNASNNLSIELDGTTASGNRLTIFGIAAGTKKLYYNTSNELGCIDLTTIQWNINGVGVASFKGTSVTSLELNGGQITNAGLIFCTGLTTGAGNITTVVCNSTTLLTNTISPSTGTTITCTSSLLSLGSGSITSTGTILAGILNGSTSVSTNLLNAYSGTDITSISNFYFKSSASLDRIIFTPSIVGGEIATFRTTAGGTGRWHFSTNSNFGYFNGSHTIYFEGTSGNMNTSGAITCTGLNTGAGSITAGIVNLTGALTVVGASINGNTFSAQLGNTYQNSIFLNSLFNSTTIGGIQLNSQYTSFTHPAQTVTASSKFLYFQPSNGTAGDFTMGINTVTNSILRTDIAGNRLVTDFLWHFSRATFVSGNEFQRFTIGANTAGSVTQVTSSTINFNTSSDYRLKQDIIPILNPLERLLKLRPKNYRFINDVLDETCCECYFDGFLAHEVQDIIPMAVTGTKDDPEKFQQLDYSKFTPLLTGAVQELNSIVENQQKNIMEKLDKQQIQLDKQQELIDKQYDIINLLINRIYKLENIN